MEEINKERVIQGVIEIVPPSGAKGGNGANESAGSTEQDWEDCVRLIEQRRQQLVIDSLKQAQHLGVRLVVRGRSVTAEPETADGLLLLFMKLVNSSDDDYFHRMLKLGGALH